MTRKWPSGVPVFRDRSYSPSFRLIGAGVGVEPGWGMMRIVFEDGRHSWRWPREVEALNADARAMLAIARGQR